MPVLRTLDDLHHIQGKVALVRVDFNVPLTGGKVSDITRLRASLPTVKALIRRGAVVLLLSHLGRPEEKPRPEFSLASVVPAYSALLGRDIRFLSNWTTSAAKRDVSAMHPGDVALLENTRFYLGEAANDPLFAATMAELGDIYVNDAFSAAHRAHASIVGVARLLPSYAGRALQAELGELQAALARLEHPFSAMIGGAKISTKLDILLRLVTKVDDLMIGGGMANTFLAAKGVAIGQSLAEHDLKAAALQVLDAAKRENCTLYLPTDVVVARELAIHPPNCRTTGVDDVAPDEMILDIGPATTAAFADVLQEARFLIWNGPLGAFETPPFDRATTALARVAAKQTRGESLISLAGGGDTVAALNNIGATSDFNHVSTGGGAFLEFVSGKRLPGIDALLGE
jgi:phosphoglycerate kinase